MTLANRVALVFGIALIAVAARYAIATNVASIERIRAARYAMERPPLDLFALCGECPTPPAISRSHPSDPVALALRGDAAWQLRKPAEARTFWAAAGDYHRLVSAGRYLEGTRDFDGAELMYSAAASVPSSDGTADLLLAALRWNRGKREEASRTYERLIARDPVRGGEVPYVSLATIYAEEKRFRDADRIVARGLALWPGSVALETAAGMTYAWSGRSALAAKTLSGVLETHPTAADACFWLGWLYEHQGDDGGATRQYSACLTRNPRNQAARNRLRELGQTPR